ncbi:MAG: helix-turn-helix domain-containing protein [Acidimicrobiales bacterium]
MSEGLLRRRLAWNLQLYRSVHGLTQKQLSAMLGYRTYQYVGGVEQQRRNLTLHTVERFASSLGIDPVDLQQPVPPETSDHCRRVTVAIDSEADDALVSVLRGFAELGLVVSVRTLDGAVLEGVPVIVTSEQVLFAGWDRSRGTRTDSTFTVDVGTVVGVTVK